MKKLIGILSIAAITIAMFFSTNAMSNANGDVDLASLLELNTANAECSWEVMLSYCYFGNVCVIQCGDGYPTYGYGLSNTP